MFRKADFSNRFEFEYSKFVSIRNHSNIRKNFEDRLPETPLLTDISVDNVFRIQVICFTTSLLQDSLNETIVLLVAMVHSRAMELFSLKKGTKIIWHIQSEIKSNKLEQRRLKLLRRNHSEHKKCDKV